MYRIRLNDGTEYAAIFCSASGGVLTMDIQSTEKFSAITNKFCENAQSVTYTYDSTEERYLGYTRPIMVATNAPGQYTIMLGKE